MWITAHLTYSLDRNSNQVRFCWEESLPSCTQTLFFALCREKTSDTQQKTQEQNLEMDGDTEEIHEVLLIHTIPAWLHQKDMVILVPSLFDHLICG